MTETLKQILEKAFMGKRIIGSCNYVHGGKGHEEPCEIIGIGFGRALPPEPHPLMLKVKYDCGEEGEEFFNYSLTEETLSEQSSPKLTNNENSPKRGHLGLYKALLRDRDIRGS